MSLRAGTIPDVVDFLRGLGIEVAPLSVISDFLPSTSLFHTLLHKPKFRAHKASVNENTLVIAVVTCCMQRAGMLELLSREPKLLGASMSTLRPAVTALREMGFSQADIARRIVQRPLLLYCKPERYREILHVMQEHGITIEVPPSTSPCP